MDRGRSSVLFDKMEKPIWVRPVSSETNYQEISHKYGAKVKLFDLVEIEEVAKRPYQHQTENIEIIPGSLRVISHCKLSGRQLNDWVSKDPLIFGDCSKSLSDDRIQSCSISLMLLKPGQYFYYAYTKEQARSKFIYKGNCYDLPVTDLSVSKMVLSGELDAIPGGDVYFTISLGHVFNNRYYKLIAGVLTV